MTSCYICNDIVSDSAPGTGVTVFKPCQHTYHLGCILNARISTCLCQRKKNVIATNEFDNILNLRATMTKNGAFGSAEEAAKSRYVFASLDDIKRRILEMQADAERSKSIIGASAIDTIQTCTLEPNGDYIRMWLQSAKTIEDVAMVARERSIGMHTLCENGIYVQELIDLMVDQLQGNLMNAFVALGVDSFEKMMLLKLLPEHMYAQYHGLFPPERMCREFKMNIHGFVALTKKNPDVFCKIKYPFSVLKELGIDVNSLVTDFGISGDHVVEYGGTIDAWIMYMGLSNINYNRLKLTPEHLLKLNWNDNDVTMKLDLEHKLDRNKRPESAHAKNRPSMYALTNGIEIRPVDAKKRVKNNKKVNI